MNKRTGDVRVLCPCCKLGMVDVEFYRDPVTGVEDVDDFWSDECECSDFLSAHSPVYGVKSDWTKWADAVADAAEDARP